MRDAINYALCAAAVLIGFADLVAVALKAGIR